MHSKKSPTVYAGLALGACLLQALPGYAACRISSVGGVAFGVYDVFATAPNNDGVGSLNVKCTGGSAATVELSRGLSSSFAPRTLRYGSYALAYNLYTTAARNVIWGDGSSGTSVMAIGKNKTGGLSVFGSIAAGQDAPVGHYVDTIIVTVDF